ncbi:hypothetical protein IWX49DRAFT_557413 [Phyllosticta citricarpa]
MSPLKSYISLFLLLIGGGLSQLVYSDWTANSTSRLPMAENNAISDWTKSYWRFGASSRPPLTTVYTDWTATSTSLLPTVGSNSTSDWTKSYYRSRISTHSPSSTVVSTVTKATTKPIQTEMHPESESGKLEPPAGVVFDRKKTTKKAKVRFCNNNNNNSKRKNKCKERKAKVGECQKFPIPKSLTAISFPGDWKCTFYANKNCDAHKGHSLFLETPNPNVEGKIKDDEKLQSFRCEPRYNHSDNAAPRASAFMCHLPHWWNGCQHVQAFEGECRDLEKDWRYKFDSFTPDDGVRCTLYEHPRCNVEAPGLVLDLDSPVNHLGIASRRTASLQCFRMEGAQMDRPHVEILEPEINEMVRTGTISAGVKPIQTLTARG